MPEELSAWIYILEHRSGNSVKIGETKVSPEQRAQDYTKTYQLKDFSLVKTYDVSKSERKDIERHAHKLLKKYQLSEMGGAREIFACSLIEAKASVEEAIEKNEIVRKLKRENEEKKEREKEERSREIKNVYRKITSDCVSKKNYEAIIKIFEADKLEDKHQFLSASQIRFLKTTVGSSYILRAQQRFLASSVGSFSSVRAELLESKNDYKIGLAMIERSVDSRGVLQEETQRIVNIGRKGLKKLKEEELRLEDDELRAEIKSEKKMRLLILGFCIVWALLQWLYLSYTN